MATLEGAHDWTLRVLLQCAAEVEDGTLTLTPSPEFLEDGPHSWAAAQDDLSARSHTIHAARFALEGGTRVSWGAASGHSTGQAGQMDGLDSVSTPHPNPRVRFTSAPAQGTLRSTRLAAAIQDSTLAWQRAEARPSAAAAPGSGTDATPAGSAESISPRAMQASSMGATAGSPMPARERASERGLANPAHRGPAESGRAEPSGAWCTAFLPDAGGQVRDGRLSVLTGRAEHAPAPGTPQERRAYLDVLIDKVHALLAAGRAGARAAAREEAERGCSPSAASGTGFALAPLSQVFRPRSERAAPGLGFEPGGRVGLEHCLSVRQQDGRARTAALLRDPPEVASSPASCALGAAECMPTEILTVQVFPPPQQPASPETLTARYNCAMGRLDWLGEAGTIPEVVAELPGDFMRAPLPLLVPAPPKPSSHANSRPAG